MEIIIYGTINSISLALIALGFALVYGISRIPNFAHGALYVVSGFITWSLLRTLDLNYLLSILLSMIITGSIGALIYQLVLIRIRGMAISEIIASYAIGLAILEGLRWKGFKGMTYTLPVFVRGSIFIADVPVDLHRVLVVLIGCAVVIFLWLFTHHTRIGLALRGVAQDERAAMMLGIDSDRMAVVAMAFGSMLAALAAVMLLPLGNIIVESGYNVLVQAVAVCIVGGLGSWVGAVLAAFLIGFAQILTVVYLGTHFQMVVALLAIIITLILRPSGLFGLQKELEERV
ncbi:MAG: branched-chain amino acid ABC transporter permease [Deltaproteobacteria bacterium]|nr:branched-chain amino acid ABC transporter permease [Deltaproteobacteria bacterium]MBW1960579.1 branched-chain amino acid ABC transporter permease [Deltaproteobacteria bacterium]MBW1995382.1 branched-chain amino acid ABC transporter permease [Deltaproteobacteria bacterium]MBW2150882.1 branched-chain amino acid ABC transporter permease [Deltaproteobacteria bacterium]